MNLANRLKQLRDAAKLTQEDAAKILNMKGRAYAHYETGRAEPSIAQILTLATFYGITVDELLMRETNVRTRVEAAYYRLPLDRRKIVDFILNL